MYDATLAVAAMPSARSIPDRSIELLGRETDLAELAAAFDLMPHHPQAMQHTKSAVRVVTISGPAGIGKTQLALAFEHAQPPETKICWWVDASTPSAAAKGLINLAAELGLVDSDELPPAEARRRLAAHLASREDWLLIFDGLDVVESARGLWPMQRAGRVLITSRSPNWSQLGKPFPLQPLPRDASIQLLRSRSGRDEPADVAGRLATALGDIPLALDQAAALIRQTRTSFTDYLRRFETHWAELLSAGKPSPQYPLSLTMSWELSFRAAEAAMPESVNLLSLCSMLAAGDVPRYLLEDIARFAPPGLDEVLGNPITRDEVVGTLVEYALADANDRTMRVHSLAAGLARSRLEADDRRRFSAAAADAMRSMFVFDDRTSADWARLAALLPHALAAAANADRENAAPVSVRMIYNHVGLYWMTLGRYEDARSVLERSLAIAVQLWGENSARLSPIANNLGRVLLRIGRPTEALARFEMGLRLDESVYGSDHAHVAESLNNRGVARYTLGQIAEAEVDFGHALQMCDHVAPMPGRRASILNNVGYAMLKRGDYAGASSRIEAALSAARIELGVAHQMVAGILRNRGEIRRHEGRFSDARDAYEEAAMIDRQSLGQDHPNFAMDLVGLADVLEHAGDLAAAREAIERAVAIESNAGVGLEKLRGRYKQLMQIAGRLRDPQLQARYAEQLRDLTRLEPAK